MDQDNAPLSFPGPVIASRSTLITYSVMAHSLSKPDSASVPGAGTITSASVSLLDDDTAGAEDAILVVRNASGALISTTTLATAPVAVPSFVQVPLSLTVGQGDFITVSWGNVSAGLIASFVTIELDTAI